MKYKKASMMRKIVISLAVFIVVTLVLVVMYNQIGRTMIDVGPSKQCKDSVIIHAISNVENQEMIKELDCPTQYIKVPKASTLFLQRSEDEYKRDVRQLLSNAMYRCYDNFWQGQLDVFSADTGLTKFCVVCSVFEFEEDKITKIDGMVEYLAKNTIPGKEQTYLEFLTPYQSNEDLMQAVRKYTDSATEETGSVLDTSNPYAVVFTFTKKQEPSMMENIVKGAATGAVVAIATGAVVLATGGVALGFVGGMLAIGGGAAIGGTYGASIEAENRWRSEIVLLPYQDLTKLQCVELRGKQQKE